MQLNELEYLDQHLQLTCHYFTAVRANVSHLPTSTQLRYIQNIIKCSCINVLFLHSNKRQSGRKVKTSLQISRKVMHKNKLTCHCSTLVVAHFVKFYASKMRIEMLTVSTFLCTNITKYIWQRNSLAILAAVFNTEQILVATNGECTNSTWFTPCVCYTANTGGS